MTIHIYIYIYIYIYMLPPPQGAPFHLYSLEKLILSRVGGEHIYIYIFICICTFAALMSLTYTSYTVSFIYYSAARSSNKVIQSICFSCTVDMMSATSEISLKTALNATNVVDLPRGPVSPTDLPLDHPQDKNKAKHFFRLS